MKQGKKLLALILALAMLASMLSGCGSNAAPTELTASQLEQIEGVTLDMDTPVLSKTFDGSALPDTVDAAAVNTPAGNASVNGTTIENVSYVMIYNPYIYNEEVTPVVNSLSPGDLSSQIQTGANRAGGLSDFTYQPGLSQAELSAGTAGMETDRTANRAGGMDPSYSKGDKHDFYLYTDAALTKRELGSFRCEYAGEHCYIWSYNSSITSEKAAELGKEFDDSIYEQDVEAFGKPRFTENGGKVNLLFYPMEMEGLGGFFCRNDIWATAEVSKSEQSRYGINTDHAIININSLQTDDKTLKTVMTHELQHNICASAAFAHEDTPFMQTWLNEAMSARAEELIYPGIKLEMGYNEPLFISENFCEGQSLYNFDTANDPVIGAYGAVYLFEKYLMENTDEAVFSRIHKYWRDNSGKDVSEAKAIYSAVSDSFRKKIDKSFTYDAAISAGFASKEEEWMSKLTLNFFLTAASTDLAELGAMLPIAQLLMLYTEVAPISIEGGGRVFVAAKNNQFTIPEDADSGLLYIGLDSSFNPITDPIGTGAADNAKTGNAGSGASTISAATGFTWNGDKTISYYLPQLAGTGVDGIVSGITDGLKSRGFTAGAKKEATSFTGVGNKAPGVLVAFNPDLSGQELTDFVKNLEAAAAAGTVVVLISAECVSADIGIELEFSSLGMPMLLLSMVFDNSDTETMKSIGGLLAENITGVLDGKQYGTLMSYAG